MNKFSSKLKEFLIDNPTLNELYLHWNEITSEGGIEICEGLLQNKNLKVLDLSSNCLGSLSAKTK